MLDTHATYRKLRNDHPFMSARRALAMAKAPDPSQVWEEASGHQRWTRKIGGFDLTMRLCNESIYPAEGDGYGEYMKEAREVRRYYDSGRWGGQYPEPAGSFPLGLPYTAFRYSGPGWTQGEQPGYFVPDGIADTFEHFRRRGQSRSVAWDLTHANVREQLRVYFASPLTNCVVVVTAARMGVKLGSSALGTTYTGDDPGYVFSCANDIMGDAIDSAKMKLTELCHAA